MTKHSDIREKVENIKGNMGKVITAENKDSKSGYSETYYYFLIPLIALLIFDLMYYKRKVFN